jgi:hypothetical protein
MAEGGSTLDLETAVDDLTLAIGQLVRRLRAEVNPGAGSTGPGGRPRPISRARSR